MMQAVDVREAWDQFVTCARKRCTAIAYQNWLAPIELLESEDGEAVLMVPNVFVKEYLLENYGEELRAFLPLDAAGQPALRFVVESRPKTQPVVTSPVGPVLVHASNEEALFPGLKLNQGYRFETFIEGPSNQFVKSAAMGIAKRPGRSYNPLFIHGGVGLGKTHLLHSVGHYVVEQHRRLRVQCITTEAFINDLVDNLRNKSIDKWKRFYRSLDVLLVDDIQFLQNRLNFEEEFCNTFEALINQNKQIIVTSDKPPGQLKLSERMVARMEWGLVAHVGMPDLETRVAILQHKADQKGLKIPTDVAFLIGEHMSSNVRQLEGALNRLSAQARLFNIPITADLAMQTLRDLFVAPTRERITVDQILKAVASVFEIRLGDLKGVGRTKEVALARQVAMFLAKEMLTESLQSIGQGFGKTHSTVLHAHRTVEEKMAQDERLRRQVAMVRRHVGQAP
jgi:chromosomal replication initiator protein